MKLELYTRPTCTDCQEGKEFLAQNSITYKEFDLTKLPEKEKELKKITGTRIVPAFVFKQKNLLGLIKKPKVIIGFEKNKEEIKNLLELNV